MLTYVIVVNDNGELKTITEDDIDNLNLNLEHGYSVAAFINEALDKRSKLEEEKLNNANGVEE